MCFNSGYGGGMGGFGGAGQYGGQSYQPGGYGNRSFNGGGFGNSMPRTGGMTPGPQTYSVAPPVPQQNPPAYEQGPNPILDSIIPPPTNYGRPNRWGVPDKPNGPAPSPILDSIIPPPTNYGRPNRWGVPDKPQTGGDFQINAPVPTQQPPSIGGGPMPVNRFQPEQPRQAPPGYYFAPNGQMLNGTDPNSFNKGGAQTPTGAPTNIYGGGAGGQYGTPGYVPGSGWQQMLNLYSQQRDQNMGQQANFGRYPDGTPIADPNMNFRANDRRQRYGGGWDY